MWVISRYPEGVVLNPKEFVLDDDGNVIKFKTKKKAKEFLVEGGVSLDVVGRGIYIEKEDDD